MKKIERLLAIILALKKNGKMTAFNIAEFLEVNVRTIYRDIDALSQMNVPIVAHPGKDGGYQIMDDYFLPSISFNRDEVLALSVAKDLILSTEIPGFEPFVHSAFLKIQNIIPADEEIRIGKLTDRILFDLKYIDPEMDGKEYFPLIKRSFEENRSLVVGYYSSKCRDVKERLVDPYFLTFSDGVWYLRGECGNKPFLWWFRLDRIKYLNLSDRIFHLPEGFDKNKFRYSESFKSLNTEDSIPFKIKMNRVLYEKVKDDIIFKNFMVDMKDEEVVVEIRTSRDEYIYEFLFRNFEQAELLAPEYKREEFLEHLRKVVKAYTQ